MREFINKEQYKKIKKKYKNSDNCCYVKLNGKKLKTLEDYYTRLSQKLQLNDSFSNNFNAYSDMMSDPFTYYNKNIIIFVIKNYDDFLSEEKSKKVIEQIFDQDIIPYFRKEISRTTMNTTNKEVHVYCL